MAVEHLDASDVTSVDDLKGFQVVESGQYHLVVAEIDESREKGPGLRVKFGVLAGTTPGQQNKTFTDLFVDPHGGQKDQGAFCRKRRIALLLATGVITPDQLGKPLSVDWQTLLERQLKAAVTSKETAAKDDPTKKYHNANIDGLEMWGPLDDVAKHIPYDNDCINAAIRRGQVNVVSKATPEMIAAAGGAPAAPQASTTAATTAATSAKPADKYAGL